MKHAPYEAAFYLKPRFFAEINHDGQRHLSPSICGLQFEKCFVLMICRKFWKCFHVCSQEADSSQRGRWFIAGDAGKPEGRTWL